MQFHYVRFHFYFCLRIRYLLLFLSVFKLLFLPSLVSHIFLCSDLFGYVICMTSLISISQSKLLGFGTIPNWWTQGKEVQQHSNNSVCIWLCWLIGLFRSWYLQPGLQFSAGRLWTRKTDIVIEGSRIASSGQPVCGAQLRDTLKKKNWLGEQL